ncbi:nitroreductase family protein [Eubacteriales bacterium OttesenSCG-928-G02]|nr:nitroreductase family protein [Eubacteriales bacterium OttesenSCG-928-G02]
MNETIKTILERRSVRAYMSILPPADEVQSIVECGSYAATALGLQPWFFSVVTDRTLLDEISAENKRIILDGEDEKAKALIDDNFDNFRGAPMAIIISGDETVKFGEVDCACATENMAIAAWAYGISSCYIASFRPAMYGEKANYFSNKLEIPIGFKPYFALSLGYAASPLPPRKEREENRIVYIK